MVTLPESGRAVTWTHGSLRPKTAPKTLCDYMKQWPPHFCRFSVCVCVLGWWLGQRIYGRPPDSWKYELLLWTVRGMYVKFNSIYKIFVNFEPYEDAHSWPGSGYFVNKHLIFFGGKGAYFNFLWINIQLLGNSQLKKIF